MGNWGCSGVGLFTTSLGKHSLGTWHPLSLHPGCPQQGHRQFLFPHQLLLSPPAKRKKNLGPNCCGAEH